MFREVYDENSKHLFVLPKSFGERLKLALVCGNFFRKVMSKIRGGFIRMDQRVGDIARYLVFRREPIKENRVVFYTFQGKYTCNSKYIAEKLLEKHPEYEVIFIVNKSVIEQENPDVPDGVKFVLKGSKTAYYVLATARVWVENALLCVWRSIPKKKGQIYINTWHGSLGIKLLNGNKYWRKRAKVSNKKVDYFLTNSTFEEGVFSESFWPDVKHLKVGHPRNDIFFNEQKMKDLKKKVYEFYGIEEHVKTVLYAPTFRENKKDVKSILMDYKKLKETMEKKFGGEWKVLVRPHFHNLKAFKLTQELDYVINASDYDDMQELMAAMDAGITDYSSWIFDYIFTGKPAFIYARDISNYINSRGFYYSLNETPFSISHDDESLTANIMAFDEEKYAADIQDFLKDKGCYEEGKASERVVDFIVSQNG